MKSPEIKLTGYSSWLTSSGGAGISGAITNAVWSDSVMMQEILPLEARSWPRADGRIDLYCGLHARCAQMLFYQAGVELPRNAYLEVGNREMWYFLHSPITNFGPALALLRSGVKVYLFVDGNTCVGGLDTATESPLP